MGRAGESAAIRPGAGRIDLALELAPAFDPEAAQQLLPLYRVRYRVECERGLSVRGILTVGRIAADLIEIELITPRIAAAGSRLWATVRTFDPISGAGRAGIAVEAELTVPGEAGRKLEVVTGEEGAAELAFELPASLYGVDVWLKATARAGKWRPSASNETSIERHVRVELETDKALYQPGQTMHVRALVFEGRGRALPDTAATFRIWDPRRRAVARAAPLTSRFGVATLDWRIPPDAPIGTYRVEAGIEDSPGSGSRILVSVSRYQLPEFAVLAEADRDFYLPGQQASVSVRGRYLFGEPVPEGRVRVVRQQGRGGEEPEDLESWEGELQEGAFRLPIDLSGHFEHLDEEEAGPSGFHQDLEYVAYLTDASTGRTEKGFFDLRITRQQIHVFPVGFFQAPGSPVSFLVKTTYADGRPAPCRLSVCSPELEGLPALRLETNRFGIARGEFAAGLLPGEDLDFVFTARDEKGWTGRALWRLPHTTLVRPDLRLQKTLLEAGEPIRLRVGHPNAAYVLLVVSGEAGTLDWRRLRLEEGEAAATIAWRESFRGRISIDAHALETGPRWYGTQRSVLFPRPGLQIRAALDQARYRPGETARARLQMLDSSGGEASGVFGVSVFDEAVQTRADQRPVLEYRGDELEVAGYRLSDLASLPAGGRGEEYDLLAEYLTRARHRYGWHFEHRRSGQFPVTPLDAYADLVGRSLAAAGVGDALTAGASEGSGFPATVQEAAAVLKRAGIDPERLLDPWDSPFRLSLVTTERNLEFVRYQDRRLYGSLPEQAERVVMSTRETLGRLVFHSRGPDRAPGTADDFQAASFAGIVRVSHEVPDGRNPPGDRSGGAVSGRVTDASGAVIPGAEVRVSAAGGELTVRLLTDDTGEYFVGKLPAGKYSISFQLTGFRQHLVEEVPVRKWLITRVDGVLQVGDVSTFLEVTASPETTSARAATLSGRVLLDGRPTAAAADTPRLRRYFPETLLWQPSLETGEEGRANLQFQLPDSITGWTLRVVGSTLDGRIGVGTARFETFQPFFVETTPPALLTVGDRVRLPLAVRSYAGRDQQVTSRLVPQDWFEALGDVPPLHLAAGAAARVELDLRAVRPRQDAPLRVEASSGVLSDALERKLEVRPHGQFIQESLSRTFQGAVTLDVVAPRAAIEGTRRAELLFFPNALSHALDGLDGIVRRPYGCGEQTISSTFPSLIVLDYARRHPEHLPDIAARASRFLQIGHQRLMSYRAGEGGFGYWSGTPPDEALTGYALRFLTRAAPLIPVSREVVGEAAVWLASRQNPDGSWRNRRGALAPSVSAGLTRSLAAALHHVGERERPEVEAALRSGLEFLRGLDPSRQSSYVLAMQVLAEVDAGCAPCSDQAIGRLLAGSRRQAPGQRFWELVGRTPLLGAGRAGRLENTALALQALLEAQRAGVRRDLEGPVSEALSYLISHKDEYGVWLSTRATAAVLDSLVLAEAGTATAGGRRLQVSVGGRQLPPVWVGDEPTHPLRFDLTPLPGRAGERVSVRLAPAGPPGSVQLRQSYTLPWSEQLHRRSDRLEFDVRYDSTRVRPGQSVLCTVRAQPAARWGMLLAEIGLPPGAEVERESLERLGGGGLVGHAEILPEKVIAYLWAGSRRTGFTFRFRPRFPMRAWTQPSVLYDYYDPDLRVEQAPTLFVVEGGSGPRLR